MTKDDLERLEKLVTAEELTDEQESEVDALMQDLANEKARLLAAIAADAVTLEARCRGLQKALKEEDGEVAIEDLVKTIVLNGLLTSAVTGLVLGELQAAEAEEAKAAEVLNEIHTKLRTNG